MWWVLIPFRARSVRQRAPQSGTKIIHYGWRCCRAYSRRSAPREGANQGTAGTHRGAPGGRSHRSTVPTPTVLECRMILPAPAETDTDTDTDPLTAEIAAERAHLSESRAALGRMRAR